MQIETVIGQESADSMIQGQLCNIVSGIIFLSYNQAVKNHLPFQQADSICFVDNRDSSREYESE